MDSFCSLLIGGIIGFIGGIVAMGSSYDTATALKLSNVMNECIDVRLCNP